MEQSLKSLNHRYSPTHFIYQQQKQYADQMIKKAASYEHVKATSEYVLLSEKGIVLREDSIYELTPVQIYNRFMLAYILLGIVLVLLYIFYRYYYKPKSQIRRYVKIFQSLGYTVYQQKFLFMGVSVGQNWKAGERDHKDALHFEKTIYSQVDISIGNVLDKVQILLINSDLTEAFLSPNTLQTYPKYLNMIHSLTKSFGYGLAFSEADEWRARKKILSKVFTFHLVKNNIPMICDICDRWFDQFDCKNLLGGNKVRYNLRKLGAKVANGVVLKCFLGVDQPKDEYEGEDYQQIVVHVIEEAGMLALDPVLGFFGNLAWNLGLTKQIRHLKESVSYMRGKSEQFLQNRKNEIENTRQPKISTDMIHALLKHNKTAEKSDFIYTDHEIVDELQTFLLAGTQAIANYLNMMVYLIAKHPDVEKRLREQVNSVIKTNQDFAHENLKKLTYIDWIQSETTRFYGPAIGNLERVALSDNYICDLPIKKGTVVNFMPVGSHFSSRHFKDPFQFRPERWETQCDNLHPFAVIGFSAGPRTCIAKQLALLQTKIALVKLIKRYESIEVPQELSMRITFSYEPEPFDMTFQKASEK